MRPRLGIFTLLATVLTAMAAPMTVKEIDFLLRQQTAEHDIAAQLQQRRLLAPLDATGERLLRERGASPALLATLKSGRFVLSPAEAQAFALRTAPPQTVPTGATPPATEQPPQPRQPAAPLDASQRYRLVEQLAGKLVHLEGDEVKSLDANRLRDVRVFAIYSSAMWCGPCRAFTPKLVEHYQRTKAQHPNFEVIFLSSDRDEFNMANYMRTHKMPWPAVRYGAQGEFQKLYCGASIPWLVCVGSDGRPLTRNGEDRQYIAPEEIMGAIDYILAQVK